jgi:DNA-binding CsgD family transcriptional regulator
MPLSMVGRAGELDELTRRWSAVATGEAGHAEDAGQAGPDKGHAGNKEQPASSTVVITGDAGVGKSRLIGAALAALTPRPTVVLSGTARVHTPAPYDWLAAVLSGRDTHDLRDLHDLPVPPDGLAWLAQDPHAPTERYTPGALLRLAVRTVRALIGAGPAVLVVEDLHALDPASLNLVGELATAPELPALLIVTSQPPTVSVAPQLTARTIARLCGAPGAVRQHLLPLSPAEVAVMLAQAYPASAIPDGVVHAVWERTSGNPYWLTELLATTAGLPPESLLLEPLPGHLELSQAAVDAELTARETEVLSCLAAGMSNKQVARSLGISIRTVTVHVSNLLRKTGSASRTEAALRAARRT